jgi:hypothetical protein
LHLHIANRSIIRVSNAKVIYTVDYTNIHKLPNPAICNNCGKEIKDGDIILSRAARHGRRHRVYCISCAKRLIIV